MIAASTHGCTISVNRCKEAKFTQQREEDITELISCLDKASDRSGHRSACERVRACV